MGAAREETIRLGLVHGDSEEVLFNTKATNGKRNEWKQNRMRGSAEEKKILTGIGYGSGLQEEI